ncbi:MAG: Kelch repeat-containing protein [Nitrospiraceae bacterium]
MHPSRGRFAPLVPLSLVSAFLLFVATFLETFHQYSSAQAGSSEKGTWSTHSPALTERTEVAATALAGKIYVMGGFSKLSFSNIMRLTVSKAVEEYDPSTDKWATKASLPTGLHHAGAGAVGERLYVIGGFTASVFSMWQPVASVFMYDPAKDAWSERSPMPTPRGALTVAVHSGKLYAIGGKGEDGNSAAVEVYDPKQNRWEARAPLPTPRDHLAAASVGQRIYTFGGRVNLNYGENLGTVEAYNPTTDKWKQGADLPTPRSGIAAGVVGGIVYVVGGESPEGTFATNEAYDPKKDQWRTMAPMPTARHGLGAVSVDRRLYVLSGGPTPGGSYSNVTEVFLPPE